MTGPDILAIAGLLITISGLFACLVAVLKLAITSKGRH